MEETQQFGLLRRFLRNHHISRDLSQRVTNFLQRLGFWVGCAPFKSESFCPAAAAFVFHILPSVYPTLASIYRVTS